MNDKNRESALRRKMRKHGYSLHKSRSRITPDNDGAYMIVDVGTNTVVTGSRFDLSLDDVSEWAQDLD